MKPKLCKDMLITIAGIAHKLWYSEYIKRNPLRYKKRRFFLIRTDNDKKLDRVFGVYGNIVCYLGIRPFTWKKPLTF